MHVSADVGTLRQQLKFQAVRFDLWLAKYRHTSRARCEQRADGEQHQHHVNPMVVDGNWRAGALEDSASGTGTGAGTGVEVEVRSI